MTLIRYNDKDWNEDEITWKSLRSHSKSQSSHMSWAGFLLAFSLLFVVAYIGDYFGDNAFWAAAAPLGAAGVYFGYIYKPNCRRCGRKEVDHVLYSDGIRRCS